MCIPVTGIGRLRPKEEPQGPAAKTRPLPEEPQSKTSSNSGSSSGQLPAQWCSKPPFLPLLRRDGVPRDQILLGLQGPDGASCFATQAPTALWSSWRKGVWLLWRLEEMRFRTQVREASRERKGLEGGGGGGVRKRERMPLPRGEPPTHPRKGGARAERDGEASAAGPLILCWKEAVVRPLHGALV